MPTVKLGYLKTSKDVDMDPDSGDGDLPYTCIRTPRAVVLPNPSRRDSRSPEGRVKEFWLEFAPIQVENLKRLMHHPPIRAHDLRPPLRFQLGAH